MTSDTPSLPRFEDVATLRAYEEVDEARALLLALQLSFSGLEERDARYGLSLLAQTIEVKLGAALRHMESGRAQE